MSPSWLNRLPIIFNKRLTVMLSPETIALVEANGGGNQIVNFDNTHQTNWLKPLAELREQLVTGKYRGYQLDCVLSQHFVRMALVSFQSGLSESEELAYFQHVLQGMYGDVAKDWTLQAQQQGLGQAWSIAAIDTLLLAELRSICDAENIRLGKLQPLVSLAGLAWSKLQVAGWLVLIEPFRLTLIYAEKDQIHATKSVRVDSDWMEQFPQLIQRETLMLQSQGILNELSAQVYVCAPYLHALPVDLKHLQNIHWLALGQAALFSPGAAIPQNSLLRASR